jgi:CheY-like chemotaxis protein
MTEAGQKTILIVEDDADAVAALKLVLEREGYRVLSAPDAQKGMEAVHAERPNLILLDIMMPSGTEGFHFVWDLRKDADPQCRDIPILVLTAIHQTTPLKLYPEQSDTTYAPYEYLPVQGFLDKPVAFDKLIEQVKSLVR